MSTTVAPIQPPTGDSLRSVDQSDSPGSWLGLAVGSVLLLFSYGANNISLAMWLAPVFLLRFVRQQRWLVWVPVLCIVEIVAWGFQLRGMFPISGISYYLFLAVTGILSLAPYAADRWLARRIGGVAATLVFPCTWTVLDYLKSLGPFASWGAAPYSQYGNLALLQILSVTGLWGITFLIGWFAAVGNYVWDDGWNSKRARMAAYLCVGIIAGVILLGELRMAFFPPSSETVRVASLSRRKLGTEASAATWKRLLANKPTTDDLAAIHNWGGAVDNDLLARTEREAQGGAKIVFWGEGNAPVFKEDEPAFLARGCELAARYHIYLGMALAVWKTGQAKPLENKLVLIQPSGQIAWQYYKAHPVPGSEASIAVTKDGKLRSLDTPFGRLSSVICFDADSPQLLTQAGALGSDIVLDPSNDWRAIDPWHTQMASFRAIEQGVNFIRQTSQGLSAAYDYQGRRLSVMDHYQTTDYDMVSEVPTRGVRTIYSRLGDWFAWLSAAGLLVLVIRAFRLSRRCRDS